MGVTDSFKLTPEGCCRGAPPAPPPQTGTLCPPGWRYYVWLNGRSTWDPRSHHSAFTQKSSSVTAPVTPRKPLHRQSPWVLSGINLVTKTVMATDTWSLSLSPHPGRKPSRGSWTSALIAQVLDGTDISEAATEGAAGKGTGHSAHEHKYYPFYPKHSKWRIPDMYRLQTTHQINRFSNNDDKLL